jgi:hypothetical protein
VARSACLETLASCAAAVHTQLAAFLEAAPGADLPRDVEHLRRQQLVVTFAESGGWTTRPERAIDPGASRSRSIDVELERAARRQIAVVEIVDLLTDGGEAMRGLADKGRCGATERRRQLERVRPSDSSLRAATAPWFASSRTCSGRASRPRPLRGWPRFVTRRGPCRKRTDLPGRVSMAAG